MNQPPAPNVAKGATVARVTFKQRLESWREHHKDVAQESLRRLLATPLPTLMTLLVIAIALSLPAGLFVLIKNVQALSEGWEGNAQVSLYLKDNAGDAQGRSLATDLALRADVKRTEYISRDRALAEFREQSGLGDRVHVDSAGTHGYHVGEPPDRRSQETAARRGYSLGALRARKFDPSDFGRFDYVIAMDRVNLSHLDAMAGDYRNRLSLFLTFAEGMGEDVPDPYYGGAAGFERVLDMVEEAHGRGDSG